jgi:hypothetical protein
MQSWKNNGKGIHIHCPEGAVPKDGPSAGAAITTAIYSLLNNIKIKHDIGITGEISLDGKVTAIGGLDLKILGGVKAGIKEFIFPVENLEDFEKLDAKFKEKIVGIHFYPVSDLQEVFNIILDYSRKINVDGLLIIEVIKRDQQYVSGFARIKPFLLGKARSIMSDIMLPYNDLLVRCHTDGFMAIQELDIKTGDQLGDLVYEGNNNVIISACNQIQYLLP